MPSPQHQFLARVVPVLRRRGEVDDADALRRRVLAEQARAATDPPARTVRGCEVTTRTDLGFPVHELRVRGTDRGAPCSTCTAGATSPTPTRGTGATWSGWPGGSTRGWCSRSTRWRRSGPGATRTRRCCRSSSSWPSSRRAAWCSPATPRAAASLSPSRSSSPPGRGHSRRTSSSSAPGSTSPTRRPARPRPTPATRGCGSPGSGSRGRGGQAATTRPGPRSARCTATRPACRPR